MSLLKPEARALCMQSKIPPLGESASGLETGSAGFPSGDLRLITGCIRLLHTTYFKLPCRTSHVSMSKIVAEILVLEEGTTHSRPIRSKQGRVPRSVETSLPSSFVEDSNVTVYSTYHSLSVSSQEN